MAGTRVPSLHDVTPDTMNPTLQVGWQVSPEANEAPQVPTSPLVGAAEASQGGGEGTVTVTTMSVVPPLGSVARTVKMALPWKEAELAVYL